MEYGVVTAYGDVRLKTIAGSVRYVGPNCTYTTIQAALNACAAGDTVLVVPGTYTEAITFTQDNITISSLGSYLNTTVTQTASMCVDFGTKEGCVLRGFTLSVTAADTILDYVISGGNDTSNNTANNIIDCKIIWASTVSAEFKAISLYDGDWVFCNCIMDFNKNNTGNSGLYGIEIAGCDNVKLYDCDMTINTACTAANNLFGIYLSTTSCTFSMWDSKLITTSAISTAGEHWAISTQGASHTVNIYNSYISAITTSSGNVRTFYIDGVSTVNAYKSWINATNTDNDGYTFYITGGGDTLNDYGCQHLDGAIGKDPTGVYNNYGSSVEANTGYGVVSPATTGGTGSAGSGNQYVPMTINGVTYKILHDGTV